MVPPQPSPKSELMRSMKKVVPVLFGMLLFALILGVQAAC
ncbi:LIV-E family branched chain amino acid permease AzlC [Neisseria wadsworthii 9715]|uniref:LIV-E family branched chain amino acid permease AzlC n=1 Tax=Neisseria wadsworthii 9715 TaxID=1030841 RepID=G4CLW4_9NEIS|nr:LIV-E family branched chain amino acid permease AzlC [Neisseria wadsworthii 9715]